ncbi:class I SAM-dependent methyltransferase [Synechococcus sp. AH-736-M20]|nr:class I SAM-dependent methyltransferase [Synechococcus sp. AH-736-M20]
MNCPCCQSSNSEIIRSTSPTVASDRKIYNNKSTFKICINCGFIYNSEGARGAELEFYSEEYDLHSESTFSEFLVYGNTGPATTQSDAILNFIKSNIRLASRGRMLEVGAGKGLFLKRFLDEYSEWNCSAIEPSSNALKYFKEVLPEVNIHPGTFESSPFLDEKFDLVASSGVIEHVPAPLEFLKLLKKVTSKNGFLYLGFPNFDVKQDDFLIYDHLNQLNPTSVDQLYRQAGLQLVGRDVSSSRIWQWDLLSPSSEIQEISNLAYSQNKQIALEANTYINNSSESFQKFIDNIKVDKFTNNLVFGIGITAIYNIADYSKNTMIKPSAHELGINYFIDDSPSLWGSKLLGAEIIGSEKIKNLIGTSQVFISANPCYHEKMVDKLCKSGIDMNNIFR